MNGMIRLTASDGHVLDAYRAEPAGKPRGGIVLVEEIFGLNSHIRAVADGFAADGYLVVAPAMFDRTERGVQLPYTQEGIVRGRQLIAATPMDVAMKDAAAAVAAASAGGKVCIIGYCWGGLVAWVAAARVEGIACAVSYYGGGMQNNIDLEPRVPVLAHFGNRDHMIPMESVRRLMDRHAKQQIHVYEAEHGFNCDERASYDPVAAKLARQRTMEFLEHNL